MSVILRDPVYHGGPTAGHKKFGGAFDAFDAFLVDKLKPTAQDPATTAIDIEGDPRSYVGTQPLSISDTSIELSGYAPTGNNYNKVLIALNGAGSFDVISGTEAAAASGIVEPSFPGSSLPVAMVLLQSVTGTLQDIETSAIEDVRPLVGGGTGGSGGAGEAQKYIDSMMTLGFFELALDLLDNEDFIDGASTMTSDVSANSQYTFDAAGQTLITNDLYRTGSVAPKQVLVMADTDDDDLTLEVSANGGSTWNTVTKNLVFSIPLADQGTDLRLRFTSVATSGSISSYAVTWDLKSGIDTLGFAFKEELAITSTPGSTVDPIHGKTGYEVSIPNNKKYVIGSPMLSVYKNGVLLSRDETSGSSWEDTNSYLELSATSVLVQEQPSASIDRFMFQVPEGRVTSSVTDVVNKFNSTFDALVSSTGDSVGPIYDTLENALSDAEDGWKILVAGETFSLASKVVITNSNITIEGKSPASLFEASASGTIDGFQITGDDVVIKGLRFKDFSDAIDLDGSRSMVLENRFTGSVLNDVDISGATDPLINNNISY